MTRYLNRAHKCEEKVAAALTKEPGARIKAFAKLRREGDFESNIAKLKSNNLNIVVVREGKVTRDDYTVCTRCCGFFTKRTIAKHLKLCYGDTAESVKRIEGLRASRMFLASALVSDEKYKSFSSEIIGRMSSNEHLFLIKNDELLMLYGYTMFEKSGSSRFDEISNKLRNVARLISEFRKMHDATVSAVELIDPSQWENIISCIKKLVKHGGCENVGVPTLLLRLGRLLADLASAKRILGIKSKNKGMVEDARDFLELHEDEWNVYANHALETLAAKKDKTPELLPLTEDLKTLREFILRELEKMMNAFKEKDLNDFFISRDEFSFLQKLVLVRIITFNARRGGETSKLLLDDFINCDKWKRSEDIERITDPCEKLLASRLKVIYSKGKRKKRAPTLFPGEVQQAIEVLIKNRTKVGVAASNEYLFACTTKRSVNPIRGWEVVHEVCLKANLKKPHLVTSTKIRKHMATVLQLLDMNNVEIEWVTEHLGHTQDVHKTWYRQEASTVELTKVAKILIAKDVGVEFTNKKMKDLTGNIFFYLWLLDCIISKTILALLYSQINFSTLCVTELDVG